MMPAAVVVKAVDESESIGIAEFGGAEEHDLRFSNRYGIDAIREIRVLSGDDRRSGGDIESFRVLVQIGPSGIITEAIAIIEKGEADLHGARRVLRRCLFRSRRACYKHACKQQKEEKGMLHLMVRFC